MEGAALLRSIGAEDLWIELARQSTIRQGNETVGNSELGMHNQRKLASHNTDKAISLAKYKHISTSDTNVHKPVPDNAQHMSETTTTLAW